MQKRPTKAELRHQLTNEIQHFLHEGGQVQEVPRGATGLIDGRYGNSLGFEKTKEQRTDLSSVINAIDQRKDNQRKPLTKRPPKPKKKIIYDDFGEPIRVVWE